MRRIILASASPRRKEILEQVGIAFEAVPSKKEEVITKSIPEEIVAELSYQKAFAAAEGITDNAVIIGADTMVAYQNKVLGKPENEQHAASMLTMLQGKDHKVYTGVTLLIQEGGEQKVLTFCEHTDVSLYEMSQEQIAAYVAAGESLDKAGAYAIQGRFAVYVKAIRGDYNTVVGLPIARICQELQKLSINLC